jgi:hypothetical protein
MRGGSRPLGEVTLCVGRKQLVALPVRLHRMMPADAEVSQAQLIVSRMAGHYRLHLVVTATIADPPAAVGPAAAVHFGWRRRKGGSVRVATWVGSQPLKVPAHLAEYVEQDSHSQSGEIILPASLMDIAGRPPALQSQRRHNFELARREVAEWLDNSPTALAEGPTAAEVRSWRRPGQLAELALRWRDRAPARGADAARKLESWRRRDRGLWEWEANERHQIATRRDDAWRKVAAWLADQVGTIVVDTADLAGLRRREIDEDPVLPGRQLRAARARSTLASPGRLRQSILAAAQWRGLRFGRSGGNI